jgi:hypothetical protein
MGLVLNAERENVEKRNVEENVGKRRKGKSIHRKHRNTRCRIEKTDRRKRSKGKDRIGKMLIEVFIVIVLADKIVYKLTGTEKRNGREWQFQISIFLSGE